jgi:hypothetical protein
MADNSCAPQLFINLSSYCYIFFIFISILSPILALNFPSSASFFHISSPVSSNMLSYEDGRLGIVIQYPLNWERIVDLDGFITFIAPKEIDSTTYPARIGL